MKLDIHRPGLARVSCILLGASIALLTAGTSSGEDWPHWRGPERNGRSAETGLLPEWPEDGPPLVWKTPGIGAGYSSLAVADGRIYTMGDLEDVQYVIALSESDGKMLWKTPVGPKHEDERPGPRSTPTFDGERVYALSTEGSLVALDPGSGKEIWRRSLPEDFGGYLMKAMGSYDWKFSESPLVDGDRIIVTPGHIEALMVALDKKSGKEIWRTQGRRLGPIGSDGAAYSSPVVSEAAGTRQYVQLVGRGLIGVEAETGKLLWWYNRVASDIANIATPIVFGDYVFGSSGYGTGAGLVKISKEGDAWKAEEVYFLEADTLQNHHGGLILHEGRIYTGTGHNKGFPIALDFLTGEVIWGPIRNKGKNSAAVTYADGRLYFRYENGLMVLIEATDEEYREHGSFMIPKPLRQSWSHPVIANGKLYLREQDNLLCYDVSLPTS
jgi:outer membrane protein assembly factor BamB